MNTDSELKNILHLALNNAVSRMETLKEPSDRRCIFNEYKEWLEENIKDDFWLIPREAIQNDNEEMNYEKETFRYSSVIET